MRQEFEIPSPLVLDSGRRDEKMDSLLRDAGFPVNQYKGDSLDEPWLIAADAAVRLINGELVDQTQVRAMKRFSSALDGWYAPPDPDQLYRKEDLIGSVSVDARHLLDKLYDVSWMAYAKRAQKLEANGTASIRLSTVQSSKGDEADAVVFDTKYSKKRIKEAVVNGWLMYTEQSIAYVGITRARKRLLLLGTPLLKNDLTALLKQHR